MKITYNRKFERDMAIVEPGEYFVSDKYVISTLLGTCVSVVLYSEERKIGGLNHYLLPDGGRKDSASMGSEAGRYGINAMELLINALMREGLEKKDLKAKVFGGGKILAVGEFGAEHVGTKNVNFVKEFLNNEKIPIVANDVGGFGGRKIYFFPWNSRVLVSRIQKSEGLLEEERNYEKSLHRKKQKKTIFIFDNKGR